MTGQKDSDRIVIASDHAGYELKEYIKGLLDARGIPYEDMGTNGPESTDYPPYGHEIASRIENGRNKRGIAICGSGIGMSIVVNRHRGVRGALCMDANMAKLSRLHNDSNVLVLGARLINKGMAGEIVRVWLETPFEGGRHARRVSQID